MPDNWEYNPADMWPQSQPRRRAHRVTVGAVVLWLVTAAGAALVTAIEWGLE